MSQVRRISLAIVVVAAIAGSYGLGRRSVHPLSASKQGRHLVYYVDPMHPGYKSDKPGMAPDCGMKLEAVFSDDAGLTATSFSQLPPGAVSIDGDKQQLLGIRVVPVESSSGSRKIRVVGRVLPEDTRVYRLNSGVDGFIRETYDDSVGVRVKKDQKLASYYSPDFLSVASGFLAASERVPGSVGTDGSRTVPFPGAVSKQGVSSLQGYSDRLRNLGMSDAQIKRIADTRQLPESIDITAPADGFILARNVSPGQHFDHAMEFYRIANLDRVWVIAEISEQEALYVHPGGQAEIILNGQGRALQGRITDSLPQSEAGGGTVKVRLEVNNPRFLLRPEMLVDVQFPVRTPAGVTVPVDALVDSGTHTRVYVEHGEGFFEPREVRTGWRFGERVEILSGVNPGERVVVAATFLVDSESRLRTPAWESVRPKTEPETKSTTSTAIKSAKDPNCGMTVDPIKSAWLGFSLAYHGATYYFCSKQCQQAFEKNPAGAAKKLQGDDD
jgi:membrane fusion protein, copper/silver efflux system